MFISFILLFFISIVIHYQWFFFIAILSHGDWGFFFSETQREFLYFPLAWQSIHLGIVNVASASMYPVNVLWGALSYFGYPISERVIYLIPIVLASILSSYFLVKQITKSYIGAFVGSIVFSYNTYFLMGQTGHLTLMVAFALAPFAILFFVRALEEYKFFFSIVSGLMLSIVSFYEFRSFYIVAWVLFFYFIGFIFFIERVSLKKVIKRGLIAVLPIVIVVLLNFYWILGLSNIGVISDNEIFSRGLFGNSFMNIERSLTLFHPFWNGGEPVAFVIQQTPILFFLIPIAAFFGLWFNRGNKNVVFFGFIALLGILLSKQVGEPFKDLYQWLYDALPGFNAFREASKFYFLIALGYSVLIGSFIAYIWERWNGERWKIYGKYIVTGVIILLFLWNAKPLVTGEIGTLFVPRSIPQDYLVTKELINKENFFRTLWVPGQSRWSFYDNTHPKIGMIGAIQSDWDHLTEQGEWEKSLPTEERITRPFELPFWDQLLDISAIKYVFIPLRDTANDDDFFKDYGDRQFFIDELDRISYLKRIDIGTEEVIVYENENYRSHIYETRREETIYENVPFEKVAFEFRNPTEYRVKLKNITESVWVNFSEKYHPEWKVRVGEFHWFDALKDKNYFLPDSFHRENDAKLNSFLIDPVYIKQNFPKDIYHENPDGSIDVELTLYFKPQSYFYLGLIISGTTLIGCLGYLGYAGIKRWNHHKKNRHA